MPGGELCLRVRPIGVQGYGKGAGTVSLGSGTGAAPNHALEPTPTASARASLPLWVRLTASVRLQQSRSDPSLWLFRGTTSEARLWQGFRLALRERGWREGENLRIESRWAEDNVARLPELAAELVRLPVDLIVTRGSIFVQGAKQATASLPIVFLGHADPLETGHVASLARPGGHITRLSLQLTDLYVKGLEFLRAAVPAATRIAVLWIPEAPSHTPGLKALEEAAGTL